MGFRQFRGYLMLVVCGVVTVLTGIILIQQLGGSTEVSILTAHFPQVNTAGLMLVCAAAGVGLFWTVRMLLRAIGDIRSGMRKTRPLQVQPTQKP